jgi:hypothetical protein
MKPGSSNGGNGRAKPELSEDRRRRNIHHRTNQNEHFTQALRPPEAFLNTEDFCIGSFAKTRFGGYIRVSVFFPGGISTENTGKPRKKPDIHRPLPFPTAAYV